MDKKEIIILTGVAGVGKDTYVDEIIKDSPDKDIGIIAYADYIKMIIRREYPYYDEEHKEIFRTLLQETGDKIRAKHSTFLIQIVIDTIHNIYYDKDLIIITDARYDEEVQFIKSVFWEHDVKCYLLEREFESQLTEQQRKHATEQRIDVEWIDKVIKL